MSFGFWGAIGLNVARLFGRSAFHLADSFFHFLAGLERDHKLLRDKDLVARPRVAGLACGTAFDLENAKISELDAVILDQRFDDGVEGLLDDLLRLELGEADLLGNGFDDLFFGHGGVPYETGQMDEGRRSQAMPLMSQV